MNERIFRAYSKSTEFQPKRFSPIGETDSERAFCVLLDRMASIWKARTATPTLRERFLIVSSFAGESQGSGTREFFVF